MVNTEHFQGIEHLLQERIKSIKEDYISSAVNSDDLSLKAKVALARGIVEFTDKDTLAVFSMTDLTIKKACMHTPTNQNVEETHRLVKELDSASLMVKQQYYQQ